MRAAIRSLFLFLSLFCLAGIALAQQKIRVVTKPVEPFSFTQNAQLAGWSGDQRAIRVGVHRHTSTFPSSEVGGSLSSMRRSERRAW